jgi:hypothetical protein
LPRTSWSVKRGAYCVGLGYQTGRRFFFFFDGSCDIIQLCNIGSPSILKKRYCANDPT